MEKTIEFAARVEEVKIKEIKFPTIGAVLFQKLICEPEFVYFDEYEEERFSASVVG